MEEIDKESNLWNKVLALEAQMETLDKEIANFKKDLEEARS